MAADRIPVDVRAARERIADLVKPSALIKAGFWQGNADLFLKLENLNIGGSFKIRGAANTIKQLRPEETAQGIVAFSAGNHAQAVASVAASLNIRATIFMPERTPLIKVDSTKKFGAKVVLTGATFDDAQQAALSHIQEQGGTLVHAFANRNVILGQATAGAEILEQLPEVDCIICPIGGGGLISGIAYAVKTAKPSVRIIGVQTAAFPALHQSFHDKVLRTAKMGETIAEGIAVKAPADITFQHVQKYVDDIVLVEEDEIVGSIMVLMERGHIIAEGAGAVAFAGLNKLQQEGRLSGLRNICCVVSGGNLDVNILKRVITYGQIFSQRMMRVRVFVNDRPGALADILRLLGSVKANVLEVQHNRLLKATQFHNVQIDLDLETMGAEHQERIRGALQESGVMFEVMSSEGNLV